MRWFAAFARAAGEWPTYGALKVTMSRLKKRTVAGGGAVSEAAAATRAGWGGSEASPSPARAIMGDAMVSTTTNLNACHICLRPPFRTGLQPRTEHGGQYGRKPSHGGERWCQSQGGAFESCRVSSE